MFKFQAKLTSPNWSRRFTPYTFSYFDFPPVRRTLLIVMINSKGIRTRFVARFGKGK